MPGGISDFGEEEVITLLLLLIFGLFMSILFYGHYPVPLPDFTQFVHTGQELLSFRFSTSLKRGPLYSIYLAGFGHLLGGEQPELRAGWILNSVLYPLNIVLMWLVGRVIIGRAAVWIAFIVAVNPWSVMVLALPLTETVLVFFILAAFCCLWRGSGWAYFFASSAALVRYEGVFLILTVFIGDLLGPHRRRRAIILGLSSLLPLSLWLLCTALHWNGGDKSHYVNYLMPFAWERLKLVLTYIWRTVFFPLFTFSPDQSIAAVPFPFIIIRTIVFVSFSGGVFFAFLRRRIKVGLLMIFAVPYLFIHVVYLFMVNRFILPIGWIVLVISWFGIQQFWATFLKQRLPRLLVQLSVLVFLILSCYRIVDLIAFFPAVAKLSPASVAVTPVAAVVMILLLLVQWKWRRPRALTGSVTVAVLIFSQILSNQMILARHLGNGSNLAEFKILAEWYVRQARPGDRLGIYLHDLVGYFAQEGPGVVVALPVSRDPVSFIEDCRGEGITYLAWAERDEKGNLPGYVDRGLKANLSPFKEPESFGPYKFVATLRGGKGHINIFRLVNRSEINP